MNGTLHPYQKDMVRFIVANKRLMVSADMGTGKSRGTATAIAFLHLTERDKTLVIAPKRVALFTWPEELAKWDDLKHLKVSVITGTPAQRKAAAEAQADVYTINYEQLPWLVEHFDSKWPFKTIVADESTRLKSFRLRQGSKRAKALAKVAHTCATRFIELTGTPAPNGLIDLWGQFWFIDKGERLGRTFNAFLERWFRAERVGADPHAIKYTPLPNAQEEIQNAIRDVCISINAAEHLGVDKPVFVEVPVTLPPKVMEQYKEFEREMFAEIQGSDVEAATAAARTMKCLQLANGAIYTDEKGGYAETHDEKLQALASIVNEANGKPVLVVYHFKSDLARILKAFPQAKALSHDNQMLRDFNDQKIPMLCIHAASAGHGLSLQHGTNLMAVFGHWWDLEQYQQVIERIGPARQKQSGYNRPTFIYNIVAKGTVDELVMARRQTKASIQDLLKQALGTMEA